MSTLTINLDDEAARLARAAAKVMNQPLDHWLRDSICQMAERPVNSSKSATRRVSPLHQGVMQAAPDFNALLEEFTPYV